MKVVAIFGEDTLNSYKRFSHIVDSIKTRSWEVVTISGSASLSEVLASGSLFSSERLITVPVAQKVSIKEYTWLFTHNSEYEGRLLLYFGDTVPAAIKKLLPKDTVYEEFKLKKELFVFLEAISPNNGSQLVNQFHNIIKIDAPELVLAMLGRHVRDLSWVKNGATDFNAPLWRMQKLTRQASKFTKEQLNKFVLDLSEADVKSKTGFGDLVTLLDLVFVKL